MRHAAHVIAGFGRRLRPCLAAALVGLPAARLGAQQDAASRLHLLVRGLTVTTRVLVIGAHPDDADEELLTLLARGRGVETGYLSLSRGESGANSVDVESGSLLGVIRTEETLAARRIDGAEQFFTRAYDFGFARNAGEAFKAWNHDTLLTDVVQIVRSFRPHVIIASYADSGSGDGDGQHQAAGVIARAVFDAAADTVRFPSQRFGIPWTPLALYRPGTGIVVDAREFDRVLGRTYADLAADARARHRTQGLADVTLATRPATRLQRVTTRPAAAAGEPGETPDDEGLFAGIDTSLARLSAGMPDEIGRALAEIAVLADSARRSLDLARPSVVVRQLARVAAFAARVRAQGPWCRHPSQDAAFPAKGPQRCEPGWLDLDASIDLVLRRADEALLIAAGVTVQARADRELLARGDTAIVTITIANHGDSAVRLDGVWVSGTMTDPLASATIIAPDSIVRLHVPVTELAEAHPWWLGRRTDEFFAPVPSAMDGVKPRGVLVGATTVPGVTVPENIRRASNVIVSMTIGGAAVSTSVGALTYRHADPVVGVQEREAAGVPAVSIGFENALEWFVAGKPVRRPLRVALESHSDAAQTFSLRIVSPAGLRVDSLPSRFTLAPHERREVTLRLRGVLAADRHEFGVAGRGRDVTYLRGLHTVQYTYLPPVRLLRGSGLYLQAVDIDIPARLSVAYVRGERDDAYAALRQVGIPVVVVTPDDLARLELSPFSAVVVGPSAYDLHRELASSNAKLMEFVRRGGTVLVMQQQTATTRSGVLPFPVRLGLPQPERVATADAPVTVTDRASRLLAWPNAIRDDDWKEWVGGRATLVPTTADGRYHTVLEMHDPGQGANRNTLLVAPMGKGTYLYSSLAFAQQIPSGVPGALRLLVNLLSASLPTGGHPSSATR